MFPLEGLLEELDDGRVLLELGEVDLRVAAWGDLLHHRSDAVEVVAEQHRDHVALDLVALDLAVQDHRQTLQATALVHEAYLRLAGENRQEHWRGRRQFFAAAAEAMRRILVEQARSKHRLKRGGDLRRVDLDSACLIAPVPSTDLVALDEALTRLDAVEPAKSDLVKLRFFAGLTMPEAAAALGISLATAERYWTFARSWLYAELTDGAAKSPK
jgi:RNA polymerase sigma factor (TIGR02999 family)